MKKFRQRISRAFGGPAEQQPAQQQQSAAAQLGNWNFEGYKNGEVAGRASSSQFFPGFMDPTLFPAFYRHDGVPQDQQRAYQRNPNGVASKYYRWSLSDSLCQLSERMLGDRIVEEDNNNHNEELKQQHQHRPAQQNNNTHQQQQEQKNGKIAPLASTESASGDRSPPVVVKLRPKKAQPQQHQRQSSKIKSWHASRWFGNVVHAASASISSSSSTCAVSRVAPEVEATSSASPPSTSGGEYVPRVRLRAKKKSGAGTVQAPPAAAHCRRLSEQEIQKRLSLPAYISIPASVLDKLSRTPTPLLDAGASPTHALMSRKCRRASLSEIGFGKAETYRKLVDLGEGTYATVFLGQSLLTGKSVALKEIRLEHEEGAPCTAIREVSLLRNLKHANIVTLHDVVHTDSVLTLVFEYVEQDLRDYMQTLREWMCVANVRLLLVQLLRGLAYCHARRILHRDLKPQNLLITQRGELKLADFGLARAQSIPTKQYSAEVVTLWYRPPDVLLGSTDYSTHIDMWGVGCILYEMLAHKPMSPGNTVDNQLDIIFRRLGTPTPKCHPELCALPGFNRWARAHPRRHRGVGLVYLPDRITVERADFLRKLLVYEGKQRLSAREAMRHPFLDCFPESLFNLPDTESVLSIPGLVFVKEGKISDSQEREEERKNPPIVPYQDSNGGTKIPYSNGNNTKKPDAGR